MATGFAALEARVNNATIKFLSNAEATIGAATVPVIFDNDYASVLGGFVESSGPACTGKTSDLAAAVQGTSITINATTYRVRGNQPDGTGITLLLLERTS